MSSLRGSPGGTMMGGVLERHNSPAPTDVRTLQLNYRRDAAGDGSVRDRVHAAGAGADPVPVWLLYLVISLFLLVLCCVCSSIARARDNVGLDLQEERRRRRRRRMNGGDGEAEEDEAAVEKRREARRQLISDSIVVKKLVLPSSQKDDSPATDVEKQAPSCQPFPTPQANPNDQSNDAGKIQDERAERDESHHVDDGGSTDECSDIEDSSSSSSPAVDDDVESPGAAPETSESAVTNVDKGVDTDGDATGAPGAAVARRKIFLGAVLDGIRHGSAYFAHDDDEEDRHEYITFSSDRQPTATATTTASATHASSCCSICLGDYLAGETVCWSKYNPDCVHAFHEDCLVMWLMDHDECPCCRSDYFSVAGGGVSLPREDTAVSNGSSTGSSTVSISTSDGEDEEEEEGEDGVVPVDGTEESP